MRVAVVGGGIFGVTIALRLDRAHHEVDLFEEKPDILQATSAINQFRLHRGYHYPRSPKTVAGLLQAEPLFREEYADAVIDDYDHYYAIARDCSLTKADAYLAFLDRFGLEYEEVYPQWVNRRNLALVIKAKESQIDPLRLKEICGKRLRASHVGLFTGQRVRPDELTHDVIVIATYAAMNDFLSEAERRTYQFEICEKPIVKLPLSLQDTSLVVMDGPFGCFDPYGRSGSFLMGHVELAVHSTNIGYTPEVGDWHLELLNRPPTRQLMFSHAPNMIQALSVFVPELRRAEYMGSLYTVRAVLPYVDETDERPSIVKVVNNRVITAFAGKIPDCVTAATEVEQLLKVWSGEYRGRAAVGL